MYYTIGASVSSLHGESTDSLIVVILRMIQLSVHPHPGTVRNKDCTTCES